jgi:hypothetical protein
MKPSQYIEQYGWIQGGFGDKKRGFCAYGAIQMAYCDVRERRDAVFAALHDAILEQGFTGIVTWNDTQDRTKEHILMILRSIGE